VSRYLNGQLVLPPETGRRIDRAVNDLGYRPDHRARSLSRGRSDAIGLVIPEIDNPFFSRLAAAVERAADARGLGVMLCSTFNKVNRELRYVEMLGVGVVDGLLFATNHNDGDGSLARAINGAAQIVLVDEDVTGANVSKIFSDNYQGGYLAGRHMIEAGHRRLAYIGGPPDLMSAQERAAGFHHSVLEGGSEAYIVAEYFGDYSANYGVDAISALLDGPASATAVFIGSDQILIGVLRVLTSRGIVVGRDLSIVTFDDANTLELLAVPVTAIRQSIEVMGARALDLVVAAVGGESEPRVERIPVELIVRESVRRLA
jgi:LacI family transcriptional regulator